MVRCGQEDENNRKSVSVFVRRRATGKDLIEAGEKIETENVAISSAPSDGSADPGGVDD